MSLSLVKIFKITAFGTLMACTGDIVHVLTATTGYRSNEPLYFWTMPYWMPIGFALASLSMVILQHYYENWVSKFTSIKKVMITTSRMQTYIIAGIGYLLVHCLSGLIKLPAGGIKDLVLLLLAVGFWFLVDRTLGRNFICFFRWGHGHTRRDYNRSFWLHALCISIQ